MSSPHAGVILFMMVSGRLPFKEHDDSSTLFKILDVSYEFPLGIDARCQDLISKLIIRSDPLLIIITAHIINLHTFF
jgi:hypothetical protein